MEVVCETESSPGYDAVFMENVRAARISGCRAGDGVKTFLAARGDGTDDIGVVDCDARGARQKTAGDAAGRVVWG